MYDDDDYPDTPDDRDPMEAPGATYCARCGLYPLMPGERHVCTE